MAKRFSYKDFEEIAAYEQDGVPVAEFKCPYSSEQCNTRILLKRADVSHYKASRARDHLLCCKGKDSSGNLAKDDPRVCVARQGSVSGKRIVRSGESSSSSGAITTFTDDATRSVICNDTTHATLQQQIDSLRSDGARELNRLSTEIASMKEMLIGRMPTLTFPIESEQLQLSMDEYVTSHHSYEDQLSTIARLNDQNKKALDLIAQIIDHWDDCDLGTVCKLYTSIKDTRGNGPILPILKKRSEVGKRPLPKRAVCMAESVDWGPKRLRGIEPIFARNDGEGSGEGIDHEKKWA